MRETWIALSLGVPLMAYALIAGEMTITSNTERFVWLFIGVLTGGVLYFSGRHFFVGAWSSFTNHSANMDTLIALGTGTAWVYSMFVVLFPEVVPEQARHVYFEATAMIIGLIDFLGSVQTAFTNPEWSIPSIPFTGYLFVAIIFWLHCFGMATYSKHLESKLNTGHKN